eukprot:IDg19334t1
MDGEICDEMCTVFRHGYTVTGAAGARRPHGAECGSCGAYNVLAFPILSLSFPAALFYMHSRWTYDSAKHAVSVGVP